MQTFHQRFRVLIIGTLLLPSLTLAGVPFKDVVENHPAYKALTKYHAQGIFNGMEGQARLDDGILKQHAILFLLKALGAPPTNNEAIARGIIKAAPESNQYLTHAEYIKMLSLAFKVPTESPQKPGDATQPWFVKPYVVAQSITAVKEEKPFDFATRGFVLRTTEIYERIFAATDAAALMDEQELRLMTTRDLLVDTKAAHEDIQKIIWINIIETENIPDSARLRAIKYFNMATLVLFELRREPSIDLRPTWEGRLQVFLDKAVKNLPESKPFSDDLARIGKSQ